MSRRADRSQEMKVVRGIEKPFSFRRPTCLTIGTFDGVHVGHQEVIRKVVDAAGASGLPSVVMTFDRHPRSSVGNGNAPPLLTCTLHKLALIEKLGVDVCILVELDRKLASMTARDFVVEVLHQKLRVAGVAVGPRLRFGKGRRGTPDLLRRLGEKLGFWVEVVGEVLVDGLPVSSTMVRRNVTEGNLLAAQSLLGRRFSIMGRVVRGKSMGRKLGFRTANVDPFDKVLPPRGVYAVEVMVGGRRHPGALNVGWRPTFSACENLPSVMEVHILGFEKPIYRKPVEIVFHRRIRDELRFATPQELAAQIALDIEEVKGYFRELTRRNLSARGAAKRILTISKRNP